MSAEARDWAYSQALKAPAKPVLVALAEHGVECWPSVTRLAEMTGYDWRTVQRAIKGLEEMGLISVEHRQGRSAIFRLKLSTTPVRETPLSEIHPCQSDTPPLSESHTPPVRESGDPCQSDTRTVKNRKRTVREPEKEAVELPEWMPTGVWAEFVEHRRKMKAPMTDVAQRRALKKLARMRTEGQDIEAVVEQSIINGWKGLFPVRADRRQADAKTGFDRSISALSSLFGEEHGQDGFSGGHGLPVGGLLEGNHERDGGGVLGPACKPAG